MDGELDRAETSAVTQHLEGCAECSAFHANRVAVRDRIREALSDDMPFELDDRLRRAISQAPLPESGRSRGRWKIVSYLAAAAALVLAIGGAYYWTPQPTTPPPESNEAYLNRIAREVAPVMSVGLKQHVHCGVFREYPQVAPSLVALASEKGSNAGLINALESHAPEQCHVVMAHICSYKGREYTHVVARGDNHLISLLITKKNDGETFDADLKAVATEVDTPIFAADAEKYAIDAFEASGFFVYLVSDLDPAENLRVLRTMTPQIRAALL